MASTSAEILIQSLDPSIPPPSNTSIHAIITLLWPYSSATRHLALLLSSPDFRLRNVGGQVRVRFTGPSATAVAKAKLGIGDEVVLELEGGKWTDVDVGTVRTPGKGVEGELVFGGRVGCRVLKRSGLGVQDVEEVGEDGWIKCDEQEVVSGLEQTEEKTQDRTPVAKRGRLQELRSSLGGEGQVYASPAFARKFRLSGEDVGDLSGSDPFIDAYWEEGSPRKKQRLSFTGVGKWRLEGRERSPQKEPEESMDLHQEVEDLISGSPTHMPPPLLPGLEMPDAVDAARSLVNNDNEAPTTPKLEPVPASNLPLPSPFPAQTVPIPWELQPPAALPPSLVTELDRPELLSTEPLVPAVSENTTQNSSLPDTDSQPFLEVPSQDATTTQTSRPSLAFTESAADSSVADVDSQAVPTGIYSIGNGNGENGTYRSEIEHPELLSDTEEDENMYDEDLRSRAAGHGMEEDLVDDDHDDHDVEIVNEDDVDEVIDDMGEEPESSDEDEQLDEGNDEDDDDQEWEDEAEVDAQSDHTTSRLPLSAPVVEQVKEDRMFDEPSHQPESITIDDSDEDGNDSILTDKPTDAAGQTELSDQRASEQAAQSGVSSQTVKIFDDVENSGTDQPVPAHTAQPQVASQTIQPAEQPAKTAVSNQFAYGQESEPAVVGETKLAGGPHQPTRPSAIPATTAAKLQSSQQQSALPETPIKSTPAIFGRQSVGSVISTPASTPQSERDRIMARTYSSLFGFGAAKPPQPTFQTPTPSGGDLPRRSWSGWGGPPIMKIRDESAEVGKEGSTSVAPSQPLGQAGVAPPKAVEQVEVVPVGETTLDAIVDSPGDTVMSTASNAAQEANSTDRNDVKDTNADPDAMNDMQTDADREESAKEDIAAILPLPTRLESMPPPQPPPSSAPPKPSQPVQVIDLGSSDVEDDGQEAGEEAASRAPSLAIAQDGGDVFIMPNLNVSESTTDLASDEYGELMSEANGRTTPPQNVTEVQPGGTHVQLTGAPAFPVDAAAGMDLDEAEDSATLRADAKKDAIATSAARLEHLVRNASQSDDAGPQRGEASDRSLKESGDATDVDTLSDAEAMSPVAPLPFVDTVTAETKAEDAATSTDRVSVIDMSESQNLETSVTTMRSVTANQVQTRRAAGLSTEQPSHPALLPTPHVSDLRSQESLQPSANRAVLPPSPQLTQGDSLSKDTETGAAIHRPNTPEPLSRRTRAGSRASSRASVEPATTHPKTPNRRSTRKSQAQSQITEEAIDEAEEDTIAVYTPSPKKTAASRTTQKSRAETSIQEMEMIQESHEKGSPPRKSLTSRLGTVPDAISAWFTPRRSTRQQATEAPDSTQSGGTLTPIGYYDPLSALSRKLNPPSQSYADNTIDILAVVTSATSTPERAKSGPRDYYTTFRVWDSSLSKTSTDSILVEVFRPWHATLPVAEVGDGILLRGFAVKSRKRNPYLLSTDASGWCVWRYGEEVGSGEKHGRTRSSFGAVGGAREEVKGPPVEVGKEERERVEELRDVWVGSGKEK